VTERFTALEGKVAIDLLRKIVNSDFAEYRVNDSTQFGIDSGWIPVTKREAELLNKLLQARDKPAEALPGPGKG
jgi:hypothetical protein